MQSSRRAIGSVDVKPIGLGCMNLSHAYGQPPTEAEAINIIHAALDLGVTHFDTAALYGFGRNEKMLGKALKGHRDKIHLASKCGMTGIDGKRVIDGRPETLLKTIDESLKNLQTDVLDLYYLHRHDLSIPIEESLGAMANMVKAGKIKEIGLSEVSADTLSQANDEFPIAALQTEYSLWSRNAEIAVLNKCRELGISFVAFSPITRGFFTGAVPALSDLLTGDIRHGMPRFQEPAFSQNQLLRRSFTSLASDAGIAPNQLLLAWLLHRGDHIIPIPGTTQLQHLESNAAACEQVLSDELMDALDQLVNQATVSGPRYPAAIQAEIGTEEFIV